MIDNQAIQDAVRQINLLSLPSIPLKKKSSLPHIACVYFVVNPDFQAMYIGRTTNLNARWANHHRYKEIRSIQNLSVSWLEVVGTASLPQIEQLSIEHFKPLLNGKTVIVTSKEVTKDISPRIIISDEIANAIQLTRKHKKIGAERVLRDITSDTSILYKIEKGVSREVSIVKLRLIEEKLELDFNLDLQRKVDEYYMSIQKQ
ncbi:MAG: GIY-YIG nuclease family protein [Cyanobacteriota bacterium]